MTGPLSRNDFLQSGPLWAYLRAIMPYYKLTQAIEYMGKVHAHIEALPRDGGYIGHADIVRDGMKLGSAEYGAVYPTKTDAKRETRKIVKKLIADLTRKPKRS